jgi:hypothetical protein
LFPFEETIGEGPHTSEKINSKGRLETEVDAEKGSWWALACWQETQEAFGLLEKAGRENLEITCLTVRRAGWPKRLFVPLISGSPFTNNSVWRWRRSGKRQQLIKAVLKWTSVKDWPGSTVLDDKKGRVKLKIYIVIMSKLTDKQKIFADRRDMQQLFKKKRMTWRRQSSRANIMDRQTFTISHPDLVKTCVSIRGQREVVQVMSEMVSSSGIRIPAVIFWQARRRVEGLQRGLSVILRSLIKPLIASGSIVAQFVAYLTERSRGSCMATTTTTRKLTTSARKGGAIATSIWETTATDSIEAAITLARIARVSGSDMGSGIGDICVGQLLLEAHLMGDEQTIDIISGDGINPSSDWGD